MIISIIIVNYNTRELLRACLHSLIQQTTDLAYEIIVVDNASTDGSREMLAREFSQVHVVPNNHNRGFASANNLGIRLASGRYVLLLNSDTIILESAIQQSLTYMAQHPHASILGCKLLNPDGTLQPSCRSFPNLWNLFCEASFLYLVFKRTRLFGGYYMSHFDHASARRVDYVMGAFLLTRRELFERVGLLDEDYFMYTEEADWCYRAAQQGYQTHFTPVAQIIHIMGGSSSNRQRYFEQLHLSQVLFLKKHFFGLRRRFAIILKQLGLAFRIPLYHVVGILRQDREQREKSRIYARVLMKTLR